MDFETDLVNELGRFRKRCIELVEKHKKACLMLEYEVENLKKRNEELEGKIVRIQNVVNDGDWGQDDDDKFLRLTIEDKVLECEKRKAETNLCSFKEKAVNAVSKSSSIVTCQESTGPSQANPGSGARPKRTYKKLVKLLD